MRFDAKTKGRELEKLEDKGVTCQTEKAALILTININMGVKRAKSLRVKERNFGCDGEECSVDCLEG